MCVKTHPATEQSLTKKARPISRASFLLLLLSVVSFGLAQASFESIQVIMLRSCLPTSSIW
jgi:hypothetical protein